MPLKEFVLCPPGRVAVTLWLLLTFVQLYYVISVTYLTRKKCLGLGLFVLFAAEFFASVILLCGLTAKPLPPFVRGVLSTPVWPWLAGEGALCAAAVLMGRALFRWRQQSTTVGIIKRTIDLLPVGVCFGDAQGMVAMANLRMDSLCRRITGKPLSDMAPFWEAVRQRGGGEADQDEIMVRLLSGPVLLFSQKAVSVGGEAYTQVTAADMTAQSRLTDELLETNARLVEIQKRFRDYGEQVDAVARMQEILAAKMVVHDEVGHTLLMAKYYVEHPEAVDDESMLAMLKKTNEYLLQAGEEDDAQTDYLNSVLRMAGDIGVAVKIHGELPREAALRTLLGHAVTECAANTLKHAGGNQMELAISREDGTLTAQITNNGEAPRGEIHESGGLLSLRRMVNRAGGEMRVESRPRFCLTIRLPVSPEEGTR